MAWLSADFDSKSLHMPVSIDILMPQGNGQGNYKTIYLLHGAGGDKTTWLLKSRIADYVEGKNIAVVMPTGNNSFYVNQRHGKNYMDYISQELPALCESWFPLSKNKQDRMIAGMSMGGYGAFVNALNHPEVFGHAASFSGALDIIQCYDNPKGFDVKRLFGERDEIENSKDDIFYITQNSKNNNTENHNTDDNTQNHYSNNHDTAYTSRYLIMCGEQDELLNMSENMYHLMENNHYKVKFEKTDGKHDFYYWDQCIIRAIEWFLEESEAE